MDLEVALKFVSNILKVKLARELRPPEVTIFRGAWQGMTYEQMANSSSYSANYLMRDIAPKFWRLLSKILGENVGKSNFRLVIEKLTASPQAELTTVPKIPNLNLKQNQQVRDWGNAPALPSVFYNRDCELQNLQQYITEDCCQLLGLWGLSGMGKTLLMKKLGEQIQKQYEVIIWRSLAVAPSLSELLQELLDSVFGTIEQNNSRLLSQFIAKMRTHSCLIMLDGIEAILQPQVFTGNYLSGYEEYGEFFRLVGETTHQSCLVFTSLENPGKIMPITSNDSPIRHFRLSGLTTVEATSLLEAEQVTADNIERDLIEYYQGNPAILTSVAKIIGELFSGSVKDFLAQKSLVFGEIDQILSKSFERLSALETEVLYWLASELEPMTLSEIQNEIPLSIYPVELIEALESLNQRSLIATSQIKQRAVFVLSPMMREFVTNQFIAQIGDQFSVENRHNSLLMDSAIELGTVEKKPIHLSQWLQNRFESGWQPVKALFAASARSPARLRSAFNLRGNEVIKRFKQIELGKDNPVIVLLLIAINREDVALKICVQAQPTPETQILPANLQLNLRDANNQVLAKIESEAQDNFIQLPYFRGVTTEKFKISLQLNSAGYEEEFIV